MVGIGGLHFYELGEMTLQGHHHQPAELHQD